MQCIVYNIYIRALICCRTLSGSRTPSGYGSMLGAVCQCPPSTTRTLPVMYVAAGEKRKMAALAISPIPCQHLYCSSPPVKGETHEWIPVSGEGSDSPSSILSA